MCWHFHFSNGVSGERSLFFPLFIADADAAAAATVATTLNTCVYCTSHVVCTHATGRSTKKKKIGRRHTLAIHAVVHNWERAWVISCCKRFGECAHARQRLEIICVFVSLHVYVCPSGKKIIIIFRCRPTDKATQSNNMLQFCTHAQHTNALPRYIYISIPIWPVPYQYAHAHWQRTH